MMKYTAALKEIARRFFEMCFNIVLITETGLYPYKNPAHPWKEYQTRRQTQAEFEGLPWRRKDISGIALIHIDPDAEYEGLRHAICLDLDGVQRNDDNQLVFTVVERLLDALGLSHTYRWVVRSGNGWHVWICISGDLPEGFLTSKSYNPGVRTGKAKGEMFKHLEVRVASCLTIIPESQHHSGRRYSWHNGEPSDPPTSVSVERLIKAVYSICEKPSARKPTVQAGRRHHRNGKANTALPDVLLDRALNRVRDGTDTRNNTGLWLACQLRDNGYSQDDALLLGPSYVEAVAHSNPADEYTFEEYQHSVEQAYNRDPREPWSTSKNLAEYEASGGRIYHTHTTDNQRKRTLIAEFDARIIAEVTSEDGTRQYRLEGITLTERFFTAEIDAEDFEDARKLQGVLGAAAGARAPVRAGMAKHLPPAIKTLSNDVEHLRRFPRTGWAQFDDRTNEFLMPGRTLGGVEIESRPKPPYAWASLAADLNDGLEALDSLILSMKNGLVMICLVYILTGPVATLAGLINERYALFIKGRTGSFKTSIVQLLMALYGEEFRLDASLIKWGEGATRNAIMAHATYACDLPLMIDNYKPATGGGDRAFVNLIHNMLEGGDRDRCNRDGSLRPTKPIRTWPISTGEDLPDTDPASLARCLALGFEWPRGEPNKNLTHAQAHAMHLPAIGTTWVRWLESDEGRTVVSDEAAKFAKRRDVWAQILHNHRTDTINPMRVASSLAANSIVFQIAKRCPDLADIFTRYEGHYREEMMRVADHMATFTAEALEAQRFISGLKSLIATERIFFANRLEATNLFESEQRRLCGWVDNEGYYLDFDRCLLEVETLLKRNGGLGGLSKRTLGSQLDELGYIAHRGPESTTRVVNCQGTNRRVLHLAREALDEPGEDNSQ